MPDVRSDTKDNKVNSVFTWAFIYGGGDGARVNRRASSYLSKDRSIGTSVSIYWIKKNSDLQNPPSGPPTFPFI
jgi:hypothetical protein